MLKNVKTLLFVASSLASSITINENIEASSTSRMQNLVLNLKRERILSQNKATYQAEHFYSLKTL